MGNRCEVEPPRAPLRGPGSVSTPHCRLRSPWAGSADTLRPEAVAGGTTKEEMGAGRGDTQAGEAWAELPLMVALGAPTPWLPASHFPGPREPL